MIQIKLDSVCAGCNNRTTLLPSTPDGYVLLGFNFSSAGKAKVELSLSGRTFLTMMSCCDHYSENLHSDLGIQVPPGESVDVNVTNLERYCCDSYVSVKYYKRNLREEFDREFTGQLEDKLDKV